MTALIEMPRFLGAGKLLGINVPYDLMIRVLILFSAGLARHPILSLTIIVGGAFSLFGTLLEFRDGISRLPITTSSKAWGATHVELVDNRVGRNLYGSSAHPNSSGDRSPRRLLIGLSPSKRSSVCCDPIETLLY